MNIIRDGKTYELSLQEMIQAVHEVIAMEKAWKEEEVAQRNADRKGPRNYKEEAAEWKAFLAKCKGLPYPHNLIVEGVYEKNIPKCKEFLASDDEVQEALATKTLECLESLKNEKRKQAVLCWYRDGLKVGEIADRIGCSLSHVYTLKDYGVGDIRSKLAYGEFTASREAIANADPQEVLIAEVRCLSARIKRYLDYAGIKTLAQLAALSREDILDIPGMAFRFGFEFENMREMELCAELYRLDAAFMHKEEETTDRPLLYMVGLPIYRALDDGGIDTVEKLLGSNKDELLKIKGIGAATIREIVRILTRNGYDCSHLEAVEKNITQETPIEDLMLKARARNCLLKAGIRTVGDVLGKTKQEMENVPEMGVATFQNVIEVLSNAGFDVSHLR